MGECIRLITVLLAYTEENSIGGILFSADFQKAFDSTEQPEAQYGYDLGGIIQGWIGYVGTHVPMFVHKLGLIKPRQT